MPCTPRKPSCIPNATLRARCKQMFMAHITDSDALLRLAHTLHLQCPVWDAETEVASCARRDFGSLSNATHDIYAAFEDVYWTCMIRHGFVGVEPAHVADPVVLRGLLLQDDPVAALCALMCCTPNDARMGAALKSVASLYSKTQPTESLCSAKAARDASRQDVRAWCASLGSRHISVRDRSLMRLIAAAVCRAERHHVCQARDVARALLLLTVKRRP